MIQFVRTGKYRTKTVRIKRFVNGVETPGDGFPVVESLLDPFGNEPGLSEDQLIDLTDSEFTARTEAFKTYLLSKYVWLSPADFINASAGTDEETCVPGSIVGGGSIPITSDTEITIYFDSSGSMNATLAPLIEMRNTLLKNALLPFYGMDSLLYNEKVQVISNSSERTMNMLNNLGNPMPNRKLIMVFQDESNPSYHSSTSIVPRKALLETDITSLRSTIISRPPNTYRGIILQVTRNFTEGAQFKAFIEAMQNGHPEYPLPYNLSDRPEITIQYDVNNGQIPQYYMDLIIMKMRELGYRI